MINLIPPSLREERLYGRRNRILITYVIALAATAILVASVMAASLKFFGTDSASLKIEIQQNEVEIAKLKSSTSELNNTVARLETVDQLYEGGVLFSELIPSIGNILPEGAVLNGLSLTSGSTDALSLDFDLERPEIAATLARNLIDSDIFEAADIGTLNPKGGEGDRYRYGVTIQASFEGAAESKAKAAAAAKAKAAAAAEATTTGDQE